jgi:autotransporter-associated beta strand protein
LAITYSAYSATTLSSNISTDGTLSVTGASTFSGGITVTSGATISTGGLTVTAGGQTITAGGLVVTAGGVNIASGSLVMGTASSSPYQEIGGTGDISMTSSATTTLSLGSTGAGKGGCIELMGPTVGGAGTERWVRITVGGNGATSTAAAGKPNEAIVASMQGRTMLFIEEGRCQP